MGAFPGLGAELQRPAVIFDNALCNRQSQTASVTAGGVIRFKNPLQILLGYSLPAILDLDAHPVTLLLQPQLNGFSRRGGLNRVQQRLPRACRS